MRKYNTDEGRGKEKILPLVEVLMRELQSLKNTVKEMKEDQSKYRLYITSLHEIHAEQISELQNYLQTSIHNKIEAVENCKMTLTSCNVDSTNNLVSFSLDNLSSFKDILNGMQDVTTFENTTLPTYDEWLANQPDPYESPDEDSSQEDESKPKKPIVPSFPIPPPSVLTPSLQTPESPHLDTEPLRRFNRPVQGLSPLVKDKVRGYTLENGVVDYKPATNIVDELKDGLIEPSKDIPYYQAFFYGRDHSNFIIEDPIQGIFIISIINPEKSERELKSCGIIVRDECKNHIHPLFPKSTRKKRICQLHNINPDIPWKEIKNPQFSEELKTMEDKELSVRYHYKFGVLYAKENQTQGEMFANREESKEFREFLDFMGKKVVLDGWTKYAAGLDTETGTTGEHSMFLSYKGMEIMYHVSTMIPFAELDEQQVERKRHLGNDVVVIVYKEGDTPFDPTIIRSHFNQIFLVVQKYEIPNSHSTYYRLSVVSKDTISPFPPYLPDPPIFKKNKALRNYIISKLINGERRNYQSEDFARRLVRARV
eukprot:CAMPEP_0206169600 /NCGR_PEP_ID=MMETSP1474-20131121/36223_1 /ASSEMBLY_ACC=CAM_ASM_001110 /TAXON_ID=97495 /ORGANISM="Imantonia sp., Strain RCC918" /LENGTH=539 /DNA_ID=CAMNT_0053575749 /DNA_START=20 /DNA_END=1636 /DNA_ORIENTATION=+